MERESELLPKKAVSWPAMTPEEAPDMAAAGGPASPSILDVGSRLTYIVLTMAAKKEGDEEPYSPTRARTLIRLILSDGVVSFSGHGLKEMAQDSMCTTDCTNVLRAGVVEEGEYINQSWRYRVRTQLFYVVVAFRSTTELVVVTAWRIRRG